MCYRNERCETVDFFDPVVSSATEIQRPSRLSLSGTTDTSGAFQTVCNDGRRFSADVLSVAAVLDDRRPTAVDRRQQQQVPGRGRAPTRASRLPAGVQTNQRRTSQPTPARARQPPCDISRSTMRRFSDNDGAARSSDSRNRSHDVGTPATTSSRLWTNVQLTAFSRRRQSVQSNQLATARDPRSAARRSSEGRGVTEVDKWWTKSTRRQSSSSSSRDRQTEPPEQSDRQLPSIHYRKRRSAPEVAFSRPCRRESSSSSRQTTGDYFCDQRRELPQLDRSETARRKRWNAAVKRLADDSFDSVLTSGLPSPTESVGSDYSSAASLSDIARGLRKDSGFRSIDTQSSYAASRKSSTGGLRRQSFQPTDDNTGRHHSIPFVANPFELPGRSSCRPAAVGPRSSGRRQSMFTRSDEVGGRDSDWLNEWLHWREGCSDGHEVDLPDVGSQATSNRHITGVWSSLSEKVERTFEGLDHVISRATAILHDRHVSSDSDNHIEC